MFNKILKISRRSQKIEDITKNMVNLCKIPLSKSKSDGGECRPKLIHRKFRPIYVSNF